MNRPGYLVLSVFGVCAALVIAYAPGVVGAQAATGTVSGRLLWGSCVRIVLPAGATAPDVVEIQPAPPNPDTPTPNIIRPPTTTRALPAGAVLVAVQNTSINARSDEAGRFTLTGVPAGQYLTVAAGPVANASTAIVSRPNVFVDGGQSVDLGNLVLGGSISPSLVCRAIAPDSATEGEPSDAPPAP